MRLPVMITSIAVAFLFFNTHAHAQDDPTTKILKSGLLGAGTGAVASGMSGGKAGKGALIGAGTGVIGSVLLDAITGTPQRRQQQYEDERYYPPDEEMDEYYTVPREDPTTKVLKDGLVGAGTGAIASGVSGGKAGEGALIGAGTGIIGNALLDAITKPSQQRQGTVYRRPRSAPVHETQQPRTKTIRKYDENGNLVYEEIIPID